jgi:hypothetical protein
MQAYFPSWKLPTDLLRLQSRPATAVQQRRSVCYAHPTWSGATALSRALSKQERYYPHELGPTQLVHEPKEL